MKDQKYFKSTMEDKLRLQSTATEKYYGQIFEEMKELEEKKSEEALPLVQKKFVLWRFQNERDEARRLQRSGNSRRVKKDAESQHSFSSESCGSSTVDHDEEMTLKPPKKRQDVEEVMDETAWKATRGREEDGECRKQEPYRSAWKASTWTSTVKATMNGSKYITLQKAK